MVGKGLVFFLGLVWVWGCVFVFLGLWFGLFGGCIGGVGWFLFDLCVFVFLLGVGVVCFVVFGRGFFCVFGYVK